MPSQQDELAPPVQEEVIPLSREDFEELCKLASPQGVALWDPFLSDAPSSSVKQSFVRPGLQKQFEFNTEVLSIISSCVRALPEEHQEKSDGHQAFVVSCSPKGTPSKLRFHFNIARQSQICSIRCGKNWRYFTLEGVLKYIGDPQAPLTSLMGTSSAHNDFVWPNFTHIFNLVLGWYRTLAQPPSASWLRCSSPTSAYNG
ncbi:unnamed protein product [Heligmosomoides polygyrus]|uniref:Calpain catalytic domain-containing protein n=1 Tax=Heligmosomoides polygyrus TaxID=6339 RepID=A0A183GG36_HELPZ|nr:unnamed protein product [Heligmosomoides polygyrus]